jgi:hypothetical protein
LFHVIILGYKDDDDNDNDDDDDDTGTLGIIILATTIDKTGKSGGYSTILLISATIGSFQTTTNKNKCWKHHSCYSSNPHHKEISL